MPAPKIKHAKLFWLGFFVFVFLVLAAHVVPVYAASTSTPALSPSPAFDVSRSNATTTKEIALTFDDGPYGTSTAEVLDILEKEHIHATFFLIGKNVEEYPALARREVADGDLIGNHSYDHSKKLATLSQSAFELNLLKAQLAIVSNTGISPTIYRPPYGLLSDAMHKVLVKDGFHTDFWTIDAEDWNYPKSPSALIIKDILAQAKPRAIILFHDGRDTHVDYPRGNLVDALPTIIDDLKKEGYTFVTVDNFTR